MASDQQPSYLDDTHRRISEFAAEFFDDEEERDEFVGTLMERRGYRRKQTTSWEPPEPPKGSAPAARKGTYFKR